MAPIGVMAEWKFTTTATGSAYAAVTGARNKQTWCAGRWIVVPLSFSQSTQIWERPPHWTESKWPVLGMRPPSHSAQFKNSRKDALMLLFCVQVCLCWFALEIPTILFSLWDISASAYFICLTDSKQMRLTNGTDRCSGRVEIFHDGQWGTVCDDKWGMQEVAVACREMNCGTAIAAKYKAFFGRGHDQVWLDDVECIGDEKFLTDCRHRGLGEHDCDHNEDAGLICSGTTSFPLVYPG